jgi:Raf kinase inhibitor-like YbhB/YbcL family protein
MRHKKMALILAALLLATQSLCFAESEDRKEDVMGIQLTSSAFKNGEMLPKKYTCDGDEVSPPLSWSGLPQATKSIAMISDDPDAPMRTFVHWVIFNIPPEEKGLPEAVPVGVKVLENGARQGVGDARQIGYISPCPPSGTHRYYFKIYALDAMLELEPGATKPALLKAMEGHILAQGELIGKYKR